MPVIENNVGLQLENIVVATDFREGAAAAVDYACGLAKKYSPTLTIAHIVDLSIATRSEDSVVGLLLDEMRRDGAENMERTLGDLNGAGVRAHGQILEDHHPAKAIVRLADSLHADMIVMATQARHGLNKLIVGSCAHGVIHHAHCPVVTLGPRVKKGLREIDTIVFATDLHHDTVEKAGVALEFAKDNVAKIYMCHVLQHAGRNFSETLEMQLDAETALGRTIPQSAYEWCSPEAIVETGKVGEHILQTAHRVSADLIVMGARRTKNWITGLGEGVVDTVVSDSACPVMTICTD